LIAETVALVTSSFQGPQCLSSVSIRKKD